MSLKPQRKRKYSDEQVARAHQLYMEGAPVSHIAEVTGIEEASARTVFSYRNMQTLPKKVRQARLRAWRVRTTDWTPLSGLKPQGGKRGHSTYTREEGRRIRDFYLSSGLSRRQIAEHLKVSESVVVKCVERSTQYTRPDTFTDDDIRRLHRDYLDVKSIRKVAEAASCSESFLHKKFHALGLFVYGIRATSPERIAEIKRLLLEKVPRSEVAERLSVDISVVRTQDRKLRARSHADLIADRPVPQWKLDGRI